MLQLVHLRLPHCRTLPRGNTQRQKRIVATTQTREATWLKRTTTPVETNSTDRSTADCMCTYFVKVHRQVLQRHVHSLGHTVFLRSQELLANVARTQTPLQEYEETVQNSRATATNAGQPERTRACTKRGSESQERPWRRSHSTLVTAVIPSALARGGFARGGFGGIGGQLCMCVRQCGVGVAKL